MAIRYRKDRKSPYQVYWNNPFTGKRESANFVTEQEAKKHDSLIKHRLKFDRKSFRKGDDKDSDKENDNNITLEQGYILYLREKQFSPKAMKWQLASMRLALKMIGNKSIDEIGKKEFEEVMQAWNERGVKKLTVRIRMSVLRAVLYWLADKDFCKKTNFSKLPKAEPERFIPPRIKELVRIWNVAPEHIRRIILIGMQCGLRVGPSELFSLKWNDVDFSRRIIRVECAKKNLNAQWREVPLKESTLSMLAIWKEEDASHNCKLIIHFNGKSIQSIKTAWKNTLKRAGITRRIRPYDLRHAFATELIAAGTDIGSVAKLMGHSSPTMVLTYYKYVMEKQKKKAIESLPELPHVPKMMCPNK